MENGTLSAGGFYAEPPLSPVSATAHVLSVAPAPTNHVADFGHSNHEPEVGTAHHVPEFAPAPPASPIADVPPAAPPAPAPEHEATPETEPESSSAPSLERMLLKFGLLTPAQLTDAMREEHTTGRPLWEIVQERGWVSRDALVRLAERTTSPPAAAEPSPEPAAAATAVVPQAEPVAEVPRPEASVPAPEPVQAPVVTSFAPVEPDPAPVVAFAPLPVAPAPEPVVAYAPAPVEPEPVVAFAPAPAEAEPTPVATFAPAPIEPEPARVVAIEPTPFVPEPAPLAAAPEPVPPTSVPEPAPLAAVPAISIVLAPAVEPDPEPEPVVALAPEPVAALEPAPTPVAPEPQSETAFRVVLRLANGERIEAHVCNGATAARRHAEDLVGGLAAGLEKWPYFSGRFVRPDSIISVDVEAAL